MHANFENWKYSLIFIIWHGKGSKGVSNWKSAMDTWQVSYIRVWLESGNYAARTLHSVHSGSLIQVN